MKHPKELEKISKGFANSWRIKILELLEQEGPLPLIEICDRLKMNIKTASAHTSRLSLAELISKKYDGHMVHHSITARGKSVLKFLRIIE